MLLSLPKLAVADAWVISNICDFVCLYVCVCVYVCPQKTTSYQHQTWYPYTLWRSLGMHWSWGQKVRGQGHMVMKPSQSHGSLVRCADAAVFCCWWRWFHLDLRSLQSTNRKTYLASKMQSLACALMTGSVQNRHWHLLTSAHSNIAFTCIWVLLVFVLL